MTILIANIGTFDLAIKIDDYFMPIGFDRSEPNINYDGLNDIEKIVWEQELRLSYIAEYLCPELGVNVDKGRFSFRELTHKILEAYQKNEETWHQRIRPGRIWGVIKSAIEPNFAVKELYIFVTDQPETEKQGYPSDSIHLFDILEKWFGREIPNLKLKKEVIPREIAANKQDPLLNHYYHFFNKIQQNETVLISIKGGTPQMQTALKMQAIACGLPKQLFIDPRLSIKRVLAGEPSECELTSYWRYIRTQKYQAVKLLFEERWDFDGAKQILNDWDKVLAFLSKAKITEENNVRNGQRRIEKIIQGLDLGIHYMNLDYESTSKQNNSELALDKTFNGWIINEGDEKLLILYTQCRIYWEINQVANFLARMSSFYEAALERLIVILGGEKYFRTDRSLNISLVRQEIGEALWRSFYDDQKQYNPILKDYENNAQGVKLDNRFAKRNFIEKLLIPHSRVDRQHWNSILQSLQSLDFWAEQRNNLIHYGAGVSKQRMQDFWNNQDYKARLACEPPQIRRVMADICQNRLGLVREDYQKQFVGSKSHFYLYSDIKEWVFRQLSDDSQM